MLKVSNISKSFGSQKIIDGLSFDVKEHCIYGFIGKNGAGKTTTMKMILGLLYADSGEIYVDGMKVAYGQTKTNEIIGYLPDVPEYYGYMKPIEYLKLCGEITGMKPDMIKKRSSELIELVGLEKANKRIHGFSRGMKQRLGIAQALLNSPKLLICDEPTSALDPVGRKEILDIIMSVKGSTTVVFSTHILSDVERVCDEIGLLHNGRLALSGNFKDIRNEHSRDDFFVEFKSSEEADRLMEEESLAGILKNSNRDNDTRIMFTSKDKSDMTILMKTLADNEYHPIRLEVIEPTLENVFMEVTGV